MADDEISDSWEALEDSGELDRRIDKIKIKQIPKKTQSTLNNSENKSALIEDTQRSVFTPQVKILKRNNSSQNELSSLASTSSTNGQINAVAKQQNLKKTLEEREAAYAEARMRIFGAATAAEGNVTDEEEPVVTPAAAKGDYSNTVIAKRLVNLRVNDGGPMIVRQPNGPDGSKGFSSNMPDSR